MDTPGHDGREKLRATTAYPDACAATPWADREGHTRANRSARRPEESVGAWTARRPGLRTGALTPSRAAHGWTPPRAAHGRFPSARCGFPSAGRRWVRERHKSSTTAARNATEDRM